MRNSVYFRSMNIKSYDFYYELRTLPFVQGIYLYGSRAKGTSMERSDIDLAIACPQASKDDWRKLLKLIHRADTLLKIDCVRLDTLEDLRLKKIIEAEKVILFERKENNYGWYEIFLDCGESIDKLEDVITCPIQNFPYMREAALQIFEYTFELFWKLLQKICRMEGLDPNSPRSTLQQAYTIQLIDDEQIWLDMLEDRNLTTHTYRQPTAKEIFAHLDQYAKVIRTAYVQIKQRYQL